MTVVFATGKERFCILKNSKKTLFVYLGILLVVFVFGYFMINSMQTASEAHSYSDVVYLFEDQKVTGYTLDLGNGELDITLKDGTVFEGAKNETDYSTGDTSLVYSTKIRSAELFLQDIYESVQEYNEKNPTARMEINYRYSSTGSWMISLTLDRVFFAVGGTHHLYDPSDECWRQDEPVWQSEYEKPGAARQKDHFCRCCRCG